MTPQRQPHEKEAGAPAPRSARLLTLLSVTSVTSPASTFHLPSPAGQGCPASFFRAIGTTLKGGPHS